jgi:hypothetical protein
MPCNLTMSNVARTVEQIVESFESFPKFCGSNPFYLIFCSSHLIMKMISFLCFDGLTP